MQSVKNNQGFTLVELLVATFIGLFLLASMIQMFLSGRASFQISQNVGRIQEDTRFAYDFLTRDLRETSNLGCLRNIRDMTPVSNNLNSLDIRVAGWDYIDTSPGDPAIDLSSSYAIDTSRGRWRGLNTGPNRRLPNWIDSVANSDAFMVKSVTQIESASVNPQSLTIGTKPTFVSIFVGSSSDTDVTEGESIIVGNCQRADQFVVDSLGTETFDFTGLRRNITPQTGASSDFLEDWDESSRVYRVNNIYYYVGLRNGADLPSLYRLRTSPGIEDDGAPEELIEGIESMQVLYGLATVDGINANRYVSARDVGDWTQVVSVRLGLVLVRPNTGDSTGTAQTFTVADGIQYESDADDTDLRYTTTITVKTRNLGLVGNYATAICRPSNALCNSQGYITSAGTP